MSQYDTNPQHQAGIVTQQIEHFRHQRYLESVKLAILDGLHEELRTDSWAAEREAVGVTMARQESAIDTLLKLAEGLPQVTDRKPAYG